MGLKKTISDIKSYLQVRNKIKHDMSFKKSLADKANDIQELYEYVSESIHREADYYYDRLDRSWSTTDKEEVKTVNNLTRIVNEIEAKGAKHMGLAHDLKEMANDAREQLYDMSEQLRTGQTVYDRSQNDVLHHEPDKAQDKEQEQQEMGL